MAHTPQPAFQPDIDFDRGRPCDTFRRMQTKRKHFSLVIYLLPAIADMVVAQFLFINAVRLSQQGASATVVANTVTTWSLVYLMCCPILGRLVTPANASRLMVGSMSLLAMISVLFTLIPGVVGVYLLMACAGVAAALFFVPFQVFMKAVDGADNKPLTYSTGLYTFAWSMGFAMGPFVSGLLMDLGPTGPDSSGGGWKYACYFAAGCSLICGIVLFLLRDLARTGPGPATPDTPAAASASIDYSRQPDLAWLGWVSAGVGVIAITYIRAIFPVRVEASLQMTESFQGLLFFLTSAAQGLTGLALCRSRYWMYRPLSIMAFGVLGIAGMLAFGFGESSLTLCIGALAFGIYGGSFFFYLVFHALVHPQRSSQYVAVNETVVGVCSMLGAVLGGFLADRLGFGSVYTSGVILIFTVLILQWIIHRRHPAAP